MILSIIVAISKNGIIGKAGTLPWHLPEDLKYFKQTTLQHPILMGRKTYESIGKALPERQNIVLTRQPKWQAPNITTIHQVSDLQNLTLIHHEVFVIGGAEIYQLCYPHCQKIYLTLIDQEVDGDTYFPMTNWQKDFHIVTQSEKMLSSKQNLFYQFLHLERNT